MEKTDFHLYHVPGKEVHQFVPDALSRLCENNMPARLEPVDDIPGPEIRPPRLNLNGGTVGHIGALQTKLRIPKDVYCKIAAVHNSTMGHWGLSLCKKKLKDQGVTDRMITQFIRQCPCCQVMSRLQVQIKTHPFTCASYNPFEVLHLDHIGPLKVDAAGNKFILVIIDAFSRWVELYPTKTTTALESSSNTLDASVPPR